MSNLPPINDHVQRTINLLVTYFKDKEKWQQFITALVNPLQELENVYQDLLLLRSLDSALGEQLDGIGDIVVLDRDGRNDDDYRIALKFKIFINKSNGEPDTLILALKVFTQATIIKYNEIYPAAFQMFTNGNYLPDDLVPTMQDIALGGVAYIPVTASYGNIPFSMSGDEITRFLCLDDGGLLQLDDGGYLDIFLNEINPIRELNTRGFAELQADVLSLDDGGLLELSDGGNLYVFDGSSDRYGGGQFCEVLTQDRYRMALLDLDDGGLLELSDGGNLYINYRKEYAIQ